jgi:WD40 repeat protein
MNHAERARRCLVSRTCRTVLILAQVSVVYFVSVSAALLYPTTLAIGQENTEVGEAKTPYQQWVQDHQARSNTEWFPGLEGSANRSKVPLRLAITSVEGDEPEAKAEVPFDSKRVTYGCYISTDWQSNHISFTSLGARGSDRTVDTNNRSRLEELLKNIPDDQAHLPPPGRRVAIQTFDGNRSQIRVFDRANAPDAVLEIIRLSGSGIRSWLPQFEPTGEWRAHRETNGVLFLSPDGQMIVSGCGDGEFKFWNPTTHALSRVVETPIDVIDGVILSPDGSIAVLERANMCEIVDTKSWSSVCQISEPMIEGRQKQLSLPRFTADGRHLLLQCREAGAKEYGFPSDLRAFDTKTWLGEDVLPGLPADIITYIESPSGKRAVILTKHGDLALWNTDKKRQYAKLAEASPIHDAAFSPDESLVAVVTRRENEYRLDYRIRVWKMTTGELLHELRPFEQDVCEAVEGLLWSPDGRYLLAATKPDSFFSSRSISIWNVQDGRQRGDLSGCPCDVTGIALLPAGKRIVAGCSDGKIRVWDYEAAIKKIKEFETSLGRAAD